MKGHYELGNVHIISRRKNLQQQKHLGIPNKERNTICVCGEIFTTTKAYAGHKASCIY